MKDENRRELKVIPGGRPTRVPVEPATVACARCGELIDLGARRCRHCGVHFDGSAFQFAPREPPRSRRRFLPGVIAFVVVVAILLWIAARST